jgi:hypothetical protein
MKVTIGLQWTSLILFAWLVPALANAEVAIVEPPRHFGEQGELVLSTDGYVALDVYGNQLTTYVTFDPAADYFMTDGFSLGAIVLFEHEMGNAPSKTTIGAGARIGYNFVLSERFSIWPRFRAVLRHYSAGSVERGAPDIYDNQLSLQLYAPVLFHPVPHFFIGFGPYIAAGGGSDYAFGLRYSFGGWLF